MEALVDLSELGRALRTALVTTDAPALGQLLVDEVEWLGSRGGACRGREEVLAVVVPFLDAARSGWVIDVRVVGRGLVMELDLAGDHPGAPVPWLGALLADGTGRIVRIQEYESPAVAEADLETLASVPAGHGVPDPTSAGVVDLVPFVHVADVGRSITFYRLLGLEVSRTHEEGATLAWAFLGHEGAAMMLASASEPVEPRDQAVLFYLYSHDLAGLRRHLLAGGVLPGEILDGSPGPRQEMRVTDPDGYCLMVAQIEEHERPGEPR